MLSMERINHSCFPQPSKVDMGLWRFMSLEKLIWILSHKKLILSRLDTLNDPHECAISLGAFLLRVENNKGFKKLLLDLLLKASKANCALIFVNCWYFNDDESEAMWRLYCGPNTGVAIRSTYQRVINSLTDSMDVYMGLVKYIDYEKESIPGDDMFCRVMHKRKAFIHEQEVRIVKQLSMSNLDTTLPERLEIEFDFETIIDNIYVNPYASEWYYDAVQEVIAKYSEKLAARVKWSNIKTRPLF